MTDIHPGNVCRNEKGQLFVVESINSACGHRYGCTPIVFGRNINNDLPIQAIEVTKVADSIQELEA